MFVRNCLSLSGGGAKGLIALHQLEYLYDLDYKNVSKHFDYISGTSTGALMTALLVRGYSPKEIIDIYKRELPSIFNKGFLRIIRGKSMYSNEYLQSLAFNLIGGVRLGEITQKILIPALNSSLDRPKIFKSHDPKDADYKLVDVVVSSASAPIYFPAHKINGNFYKDGGLFANNPSEKLLKECRKEAYDLGQEIDAINILSITTGGKGKRLSKSEQNGGILSLPEMVNETLYQQDLEIHGSVSFEYNEIKQVKGLYHRCESTIEYSSGKIDDVSNENIENMILDGKLSVLENKNKMLDFYQKTKK